MGIPNIELEMKAKNEEIRYMGTNDVFVLSEVSHHCVQVSLTTNDTAVTINDYCVIYREYLCIQKFTGFKLHPG